ncbi:DUF1097 domain-containing protein [Clostridium sp. WILCCON 0269]|uniref:DUF1097 domain-containing protein n=1 Tax=Candidatus Clostridium eludens TaxID=3381663 RepID=A0ABW8SDB6_9CLOT
MKAKIPIEIVVAVLAALSCLVSLPGLGFPVWALFIGWAWYFALGATPSTMKSIYPSMLPGALLAVLCIFLINGFGKSMPSMPAMMIAVLITVFLLMVCLKIPYTNCSLSAFNAYSTTFAVFYGGFFPKTGVASHDILMALVWALIGNGLGPIFGYLSIVFTMPAKDE